MNELVLASMHCQKFVDAVFQYCSAHQRQAALLKRADKLLMEYQTWPILALFDIDLTNKNKRLAYSLIAVIIAYSQNHKNGQLRFSVALSRLFQESSESDLASIYLRRLLSCNRIEELYLILCSLVKLIQKQQKETLDYATLLDDLLCFNEKQQQVKMRWTHEFYRGIRSPCVGAK